MEITDRHRWKMVDAGMSMPVPLQEADLTKPFIYQRGFGISYVNLGHHMTVMSLLYIFNKGYIDYIDLLEDDKVDNNMECWEMADAWLELPGTAFRSSVGKGVIFNNLSLFEEKYFRGYT